MLLSSYFDVALTIFLGQNMTYDEYCFFHFSSSQLNSDNIQQLTLQGMSLN